MAGNDSGLTSSELLVDRSISTAPQDDSLLSRLTREAQLLTYGTGLGFAEQAGNAFSSENVGNTTLKFAGAVALGAAMTYLSHGKTLSRTIAQAAGSTMTLGFVADLANKDRLNALGGAMSETWSSGQNFNSNLDTVKGHLGTLAVDLTIMGAGGAVGAYGVHSGKFSAAYESMRGSLTRQAELLSTALDPMGGLRPAYATAGYEMPIRDAHVVRPQDNIAMMANDNLRTGGKTGESRQVGYWSLSSELKEASKLDNGIPGQEKVAGLLKELFAKNAKGGMKIDVVEIPPGTVGDRSFKTDALFVIHQNGQATAAWPVDFSFSTKPALEHVLKLNHDWFLYDSKTGALTGLVNDAITSGAVWTKAMQFMKQPGLMQTFKKPVPLSFLHDNRSDLRFSMTGGLPRLELGK